MGPPATLLALIVALGIASPTLAGTEDFERLADKTDLTTEPNLLAQGVRFQNHDTCELDKGTCFLTGFSCSSDDDCFLFGDRFVDYRPCGGAGLCGSTGIACETDDDCLFPFELAHSEVVDCTAGCSFGPGQKHKHVMNAFAVCFDEPVGEVEWRARLYCGGRGPHVHVRDTQGNAEQRCTRCTKVQMTDAPIECVTVRADACSGFDLLQWRPPACAGVETSEVIVTKPSPRSRGLTTSYLSIPDLRDAPSAACAVDDDLPADYVVTPRFVSFDVSHDARSPIDLADMELRQGFRFQDILSFYDTPPPDTIILPLGGDSTTVSVDVPITYGASNPTTLSAPWPLTDHVQAERVRIKMSFRGSVCSQDSRPVDSSQPPIAVKLPLLKGLWQVPSSLARTGCRTTAVGGHDGWAAQRTVAFLERHAASLPPIGDVSAEHAQVFGSHRGHRAGLDFDTFHFAELPDPPGLTSPPGARTSGVWNLVRLRGWASIAANPADPDFDTAKAELAAFVSATRAGLQALVSDDEVRRVVTAHGDAIEGDGPSLPLDGWISAIVRTGELPTTDGTVPIVAGSFDNAKIGWQDDHNTHNHVSLCPASCDSDDAGGCLGGLSQRQTCP